MIIFQLLDVTLFENSSIICFGNDQLGKSVAVHLSEKALSDMNVFYIQASTSLASIDEFIVTLNLLVKKKLERIASLQRCLNDGCGTCDDHQKNWRPALLQSKFGPSLESICRSQAAAVLAVVKNRTCELVRTVNEDNNALLFKSMVGYSASASKFFKIEVLNYSILKLVKTIVAAERGNLETSQIAQWEYYELNLDTVMRFMAHFKLTGGCMIRCCSSSNVSETKRFTTCDIEIRDPEEFSVVDDDPVLLKTNFPLRVTSFDIECITYTPNKFPVAKDGDPVIQIGLVCETLFAADNVADNVVLCLDTVHPIPSGRIESFATEADLLRTFCKYIQEKTDVLVGFNSSQFDFPYLMDRAEALGVVEMRYLSKLRAPHCVYRWESVFASAQAGTNITIAYHLPGIVKFDLFNFFKRNMKLQKYSLDFISKTLLPASQENQKLEIKYSDLAPFQQAGPDKRAIIAEYCLQDTVLCSKLLHAQKLVVQGVEFARLCGVLLDHSWTKGVSYKILRKLLEYTRREEYLIPSFASDADTGAKIVPYYDGIVNPKARYVEEEEEAAVEKKRGPKQSKLTDKRRHKRQKNAADELEITLLLNQDEDKNDAHSQHDDAVRGGSKRLVYQGAFVLDPITGFHEDVVATLDFASLYPSEQRAHNMCTSTLLQSEDQARQLGVEYEVVDSGYIFVKRAVCEGIMPMIQNELAAARKAAKADLKVAMQAGDEPLAAVLDARQLAVKLIANSIYGYCGSPTSALAALPIAISITAQGRFDLMQTKAWLETNYTTIFSNQPNASCKIIYGDTVSRRFLL